MIDMKTVINELSRRRKIFVSEADFQLEMAMLLREMYPEAKVRLEYTPSFEPNMHIDILVILDGKWYPIELKYKTRSCHKIIDGDEYFLKEQSAVDGGMYLYLKDIQRIERVRENTSEFAEGYTVFITNAMTYLKKPQEGVNHEAFALTDGSVKSGVLKWSEAAGEGSIKGHADAIVLKDKYPMRWERYSEIDDTKTGKFMCLMNTIKK